MSKIVCELGGIRIYFPDYIRFSRMERDHKIRSLYNGANGVELALRFDLSQNQIRNIINGDD